MGISRINNNVSALNAIGELNRTGNRISENIARLSSGLRIKNAGDDAVGLTIRERLRTQIRGTDQALQNAQLSMSMVNTTEASLDSMVSSLQRIRVLAIQAGNTGSNDFEALRAIQEEIFQQIDQVDRIAKTSRFSSQVLFTGDHANTSEIKRGQDELGVRISEDPNASNLKSGTSLLNIVRTKAGSETLIPFKKQDGQALFATGIKNATDIAVTASAFTRDALNRGAISTDELRDLTFDGVSINQNNIVAFQGVLSDGVTPFAGAISVGANNVADLITQVQTAIDNAETALFGGDPAEIPESFVQTHVSIPANGAGTANGEGRLRFLSAKADGTTNTTFNNTTNAPSLFEIDFKIVDTNGNLKRSVGTTRDLVNGVRVGGQIGNDVQAITGSTFDTGNFDIEVSDVLAPQRRQVKSEIAFHNTQGAILSANISLAGNGIFNGTFVDGIMTTGEEGIGFEAGDTIEIVGTNADGTTFQNTFTIVNQPAADTNLGDGQIMSIQGLIDELNNRDRTTGANAPSGQSAFEDAVLTFTQEGKLQLIDDMAQESKSSFFMIVEDNNSTQTKTDRARLIREGTPETATIRINGGPRQRVAVGEQVVLQGPEPTLAGENIPQLTMRLGGGFRQSLADTLMANGADTAEIEAQEFVGRLNGGPAVTFQNGDQNVFFESGSREDVAETLRLDFDAVLDITGPPTDNGNNNGMAIQISTVNHALNFQVGAFKNQELQINIPDLRADNLGFGRGSGRTVMDINATTVKGANKALEIVDRALEQINRTRSQLGAFTNRLENTIGKLSADSENLNASESLISDVDIAAETSDFANNQILFQAGTSVLAQANFVPQGLLSLLG